MSNEENKTNIYGLPTKLTIEECTKKWNFYDENDVPTMSDFMKQQFVYDKPVESINGTGRRISLFIKGPENTIHQPSVLTDNNLFSFGIKEQQGGGWKLPINLTTNGSTEWYENYLKLCDNFRKHFVKHRIGYSKLGLEKEMKDPTKVNDDTLSVIIEENFSNGIWKSENKYDGTTNFFLYPKIQFRKNKLYSGLMICQKGNKYFQIEDEEGLTKYKDQKFNVKAMILSIESIYCGNKMSLQVKVVEAVLEPLESSKKVSKLSSILNITKVEENKDEDEEDKKDKEDDLDEDEDKHDENTDISSELKETISEIDSDSGSLIDDTDDTKSVKINVKKIKAKPTKKKIVRRVKKESTK